MDYFKVLASAYVRGCSEKNKLKLRYELTSTSLESLTEKQADEIIEVGNINGLRMYRFNEIADFPYVNEALSFLKNVYPETLLDVGSGKGEFLFRFLRDFPETEVISIDISKPRIDFLHAMRLGGLDWMNALQKDICIWDAPDNIFDVVTMLEVLRFTPDYKKAIQNAVRLARRYVLVSVSKKPSDNQLTKENLAAAFVAAGIAKIEFKDTNGSLFLIAYKK